MRKLYHYWFCPFSRKVRIALYEKEIECELLLELPWKRRHEFLMINPAGTVPALIDDDETIVAGSTAISEYLDDVYPTPHLTGEDPKVSAEVRRLVEWFDRKFNREVTELVINEKVTKRFLKRGTPEAKSIRYAAQNIKPHLQYIEYLTDRRNWLAGNDFSYADMSAAAHLSCIDYFGDVPWEKFPAARDWYARLKSRPSMQHILKDNISGLIPASHYRDPDF